MDAGLLLRDAPAGGYSGIRRTSGHASARGNDPGLAGNEHSEGGWLVIIFVYFTKHIY
jgi:hypothetical protein